jgi:hypothetical protein
MAVTVTADNPEIANKLNTTDNFDNTDNTDNADNTKNTDNTDNTDNPLVCGRLCRDFISCKLHDFTRRVGTRPNPPLATAAHGPF